MNGIFFVLRGGVQWHLLPNSTVYGCSSAWRDSDLFASINHHLVVLDGERVGRETGSVGADERRPSMSVGGDEETA